MLIWRDVRKKGGIELHHLGNLSLTLEVENPSPQRPIPNWETDVEIGSGYTDEYLSVDIQHDFYFTYERFTGRKYTTERISFENPICLFRLKGNGAELAVRSRGLVPLQHPVVSNYDNYFQGSDYDIPVIDGVFFGWAYVKRQQGNRVMRYVTNREFDFMIEGGLEKDVRRFLPWQLFKPLTESAPDYVLDVLDLLNKV